MRPDRKHELSKYKLSAHMLFERDDSAALESMEFMKLHGKLLRVQGTTKPNGETGADQYWLCFTHPDRVGKKTQGVLDLLMDYDRRRPDDRRVWQPASYGAHPQNKPKIIGNSGIGVCVGVIKLTEAGMNFLQQNIPINSWGNVTHEQREDYVKAMATKEKQGWNYMFSKNRHHDFAKATIRER